MRAPRKPVDFKSIDSITVVTQEPELVKAFRKACRINRINQAALMRDLMRRVIKAVK
jgi:hypothetical protein